MQVPGLGAGKAKASAWIASRLEAWEWKAFSVAFSLKKKTKLLYSVGV